MNQSGAAAHFAIRFQIGYRFSMVLCMLSEFRSPSIQLLARAINMFQYGTLYL